MTTQTPPPTPPTAPVKSATSETAVQEAVQKTLTQQQNRAIFPAGVHVLHVTIQDKVVTLDMSAEFNALANMGDTTESEAQKALRATLQAFPDIEKMRVTVKGKAFDSQVTDWNTPFSVRATEGETHSGETTANKQTSTQDLHTP